MIKINIKNFQSLKDTSLEVKGLTAVTGPNNSGKTALMRAVKEVFQNKGGSSFIRMGEQTSQVDIDFGDGKVTWIKSLDKKVKTQYKINDGESIFPGREVPDEVSSLGVRPILLGGDYVWPNIASQFTGQIFLLDKPGSVLAEAVSDVERVSSLNSAMRKADSDKRNTNSKIASKKEDLINTNNQLDFYEGLDTLLGELESLKEEDVLITKHKTLLNTLIQLKNRYDDAKSRIRPFPELDLNNNINEITQKLSELLRLSKSVPIIKEWEPPMLETPSDINNTKDLINQALIFLNKTNTSKEALSNFNKLLDQNNNNLASLDKEIHSILQDHGSCPVCGNNI
jgi:DNA repair exonuclease SbcCD ATPase subunit